jgi:hypothetical protein
MVDVLRAVVPLQHDHLDHQLPEISEYYLALR